MFSLRATCHCFYGRRYVFNLRFVLSLYCKADSKQDKAEESTDERSSAEIEPKRRAEKIVQKEDSQDEKSGDTAKEKKNGNGKASAEAAVTGKEEPRRHRMERRSIKEETSSTTAATSLSLDSFKFSKRRGR